MKKQIRKLANENAEKSINQFFGVEGSYVENKENTMFGIGKAIATGIGLYKASELVNKKSEKLKEGVAGIAVSNGVEKKHRRPANGPVVYENQKELDFNL